MPVIYILHLDLRLESEIVRESVYVTCIVSWETIVKAVSKKVHVCSDSHRALELSHDLLALLSKSAGLGISCIEIRLQCRSCAEECHTAKNEERNHIADSDGRFPNHHPDPSIEGNLEKLKEVVLSSGADVGLSFDGDGDRVGVITNSGKFISADKYMIMIIRDIINKVDKKEFLYDIKCSKALEDEIVKLGGVPHIYRTGASYTKAGVKEFDLPFGGELSGHVYFRDKFLGFDSGLYAGLRLLEILSHTTKSVDDLLEGINHYESTPEIKYNTTDENKFVLVRKVMDYASNKNYKCITIDGVKVLFDDGFALVRASNTGPNVTSRFEALTKERMEEIKSEFEEIILKNL